MNLVVKIGYRVLSDVNDVATIAFYVGDTITHIVSGPSSVMTEKIEGVFK